MKLVSNELFDRLFILVTGIIYELPKLIHESYKSKIIWSFNASLMAKKNYNDGGKWWGRSLAFVIF